MMRSLAMIAFGSLLALTALALVPNAAAYPPVCIERNLEYGPVTAHVGQCGDQSIHVVDCSSGGAQGIHYSNDVGPANVLVDYCFPHGPPP